MLLANLVAWELFIVLIPVILIVFIKKIGDNLTPGEVHEFRIRIYSWKTGLILLLLIVVILYLIFGN